MEEQRAREEAIIAAMEKLEEEAVRFSRIAAEDGGEGRTVNTMVDVGCEVYSRAEIDVEVRRCIMRVSVVASCFRFACCVS